MSAADLSVRLATQSPVAVSRHARPSRRTNFSLISPDNPKSHIISQDNRRSIRKTYIYDIIMVFLHKARVMPAVLRQPEGRPNWFNLLDIPSSTPTTQTVRMSRAQKAKPRVWQPKSILSKNMRRARKLDAAAPTQARYCQEAQWAKLLRLQPLPRGLQIQHQRNHRQEDPHPEAN
jgi:hypothetical protein